MTLVISAINSRFNIQVSDRLLTYSSTRKNFDHDANKMVIIQNIESVFCVGYSGSAYIGKTMTDNWIFRILLSNNAAKYNMGYLIATLTNAASKTYKDLGIGGSPNEYLEFTVSGFHYKKKNIIPYIWYINNKDKNGKLGDKFYGSPYRKSKTAKNNEFAAIEAIGDVKSLDHKKMEDLLQRLKTEENGQKFVEELVIAIRENADKSQTIGKDCVSFFESLKGDIVVEYHPYSKKTVSYSPHIISSGVVMPKSVIVGPAPSLSIGRRKLSIRVPMTGPGNIIKLSTKKDDPKKPT